MIQRVKFTASPVACTFGSKLLIIVIVRKTANNAPTWRHPGERRIRTFESMAKQDSQRGVSVMIFLSGTIVGCALTLGGVFLWNRMIDRGDLAEVSRAGHLAASPSHLQQENSEPHANIQDSVAKGAQTASQIDQRESQRDTATRGLEGADAVTRDLIGQVRRDLQRHADQYALALGRFKELGGIDASNLQSQEMIASRLKALDEMETVNTAFTSFLQQLEDQLRIDLMVADVPPSDARARAANVAAEAHAVLALEIRETDRQIIQSARSLLTFLEQRWGAWRFDSIDRTLRFSADADTKQYNETFRKLQAASTQQSILQDEVRKHGKFRNDE